MKYSIIPHVFSCTHDTSSTSPLVHGVLGGMTIPVNADDAQNTMHPTTAREGVANSKNDSRAPSKSSLYTQRLSEKQCPVANPGRHRPPLHAMSPDHGSSRTEAAQHWRPPGACVRRAQQAQPLGTPASKTSPKTTKAKGSAAMYSCRPVSLDAAFDSPMTPEHCHASEVNQKDLRLTPPSLQSPAVMPLYNLGCNFGPADGLSNVHAADGGLKHLRSQIKPPSKGGVAMAEPVRVPTTAGGNRKQGLLRSRSNGIGGQNYSLSKTSLHTSPQAASEAPTAPMAHSQSCLRPYDHAASPNQQLVQAEAPLNVRASWGQSVTRNLPVAAQTPSLKRSRSVVTCDGDTHAICQSAGETVLQPGSVPSNRRPASADPVLIPPIAHILACADEQRQICRGPHSKGACCPVLHEGCGFTAEAPTSDCNDSLAASSKELLAEVTLAQPTTSESGSGNAHAGSTAALCGDDGTFRTVQPQFAAASRPCAAELPAPQPGVHGPCAPLVFEPRAGVFGPAADGSVEAGCWFGTKACKSQSVGVQAQADCVGWDGGVQSMPVVGPSASTMCGIAPAVSAVDREVQVSLPQQRTAACHVAIEAVPARADGAVQCTLLPSREMANSAPVHRSGAAGQLHDAALPATRPGAVGAECMRQGVAAVEHARADWRRQIGVVQQFICERIVPLLVVCSRGGPDEALGPLTGQALSMLSEEAAQEWEDVMRVLQQAATVLEGAALSTRQLNADLSATQVQLRASEFELKALRAEHAALQRKLQAQEREALCHQQEEETCARERHAAVQDELARERNAKEVLAFALGRVLRETQWSDQGQERHCAADPEGGVDELQAQMHRMSVQDSPPASVRAAVIQNSVAAAQRILEMPAAELSSRFASVSPERQDHSARTSRGWFDSACLDSRVLRFAPSDVSPLAATPQHSTAHGAMQHSLLSQAPDTSSLFPGVASSTRAHVAAPCPPVIAPTSPEAVADPAQPPSPGMLPEASFNFGLAGTRRTPAGASAVAAQPSTEEHAAQESAEASAPDGGQPAERRPEGGVQDRSPSPSNPMCTPSSAGTSHRGGERNENQPPISEGRYSGGAREQLPGPDLSPLAAWKTGHARDAAPSVVHSSGAAEPGALVGQVSSQGWLEDVIQPTGEPCSFAIGKTPAMPMPQRQSAQSPSPMLSDGVPAPGPEQVKRKRESENPHKSTSSRSSPARDDVAAELDVQADAAAPRWSERSEWPGDEGPRPVFSSNSPELVDRYKDNEASPQEAAPVAGFKVPDVHSQPGDARGADGKAAVGRKLVMSGLHASGGGPFSVLPRSGPGDRLHEQDYSTRPPTDPGESSAAAEVTPAGPRSLQWLAALEGQVAPKSFNSQLGATAMHRSLDTASPQPQPRAYNRLGDSRPNPGTAQQPREGAPGAAHDGIFAGLDDRERAVHATGRAEGQGAAAATGRTHPTDRYDDWLTEQLAAAQRDVGDEGQPVRHTNDLKTLAAACGGDAEVLELSDSDSDGDSASTAPSDSAGTDGALDSHVASPKGSSMNEPFAWRGKLPGATARAAALEIRHFCAMSQQSNGSRAQRSGSSRVKGKVPAERHKPSTRRKKPKPRLIVPHSPDLATARRVHGEMGPGEVLTASKERARWVADAGRKRATVLAGHFRGSYAQRAAAWGRLRKAGAEVGYATLAKQRKKTAIQDSG